MTRDCLPAHLVAPLILDLKSVDSVKVNKQQFIESPDGDMPATSRLVCGGAAGITSVTVTYPLDIVRTRLSIQSASFADLGKRDSSQKLPGMFTTMVMIYKNEGGIIALYRGIVPTVAGVAPYVR